MSGLPRVLLVYPGTKPQVNPPLGILYIAAYLEKRGIPVKVMDCSFYESVDAVKGVLQEYKPQIVGISTLFTPLYPATKRVAGIVKEFDQNTWVVLGGMHPTAMPKECLEEAEADIVVRGEGEYIIYTICKHFPDRSNLNTINGIVYKNSKGEIVETTPQEVINNIDELPFPARHLVDMKIYFNFKGTDRIKWSLPHPGLPIIASRGCPFKCTFCASNLVHGRKLRFRSPENIGDEIQQLIKNYGVKSIYFYDDTFTLNKKWLFRLCEVLLNLKVKWICGTRVDQIDEEKLIKIKEAGCVLISYGVESGDERILNGVLKKGIHLNQVKCAFSLTRKVGIKTIANFMLGVPGDTEETMQKTIDFSKKIEADVVEFSVYNPLPGTELEATAQQISTLFQKDFGEYDYSRPIFESPSLSAEIIRKYHQRAVRGFYLRPRYILQHLVQTRSFSDIRRHWAGLGSFRGLLRRMRS